jgi:hypothetical protein
MQEQPEYDSNYPNYAGAGAGAAAAAVTAGVGYDHQNQAHQYVEYPVGAPSQQNQSQQGYYPPAQGQAQGSDEVAAVGVGSSGLRDGSMVRVKVGFVRSLEDELGE